MRKDLARKIEIYKKKWIRKKKYAVAVSILALVVGIGTVLSLMLPAITMSTICGLDDHTHDANCFSIIEPLSSREIACGTEYSPYFILHTHDEFCYDANDSLICPLTVIIEHQHSNTCYTEQQQLICHQDESTPHYHTESCFENSRAPICEMEENDGHWHVESCFEDPRTPVCGIAENSDHRHFETCFENPRSPICGYAETSGHTHNDSCFETELILSCGKKEFVHHMHSELCADGSCGLVEAVVHQHSESCIQETEKSSESVLICQIPEHTHSPECYPDQGTVCGIKAHIHTTSCFDENGDLICEKVEHEHTDSCTEPSVAPATEELHPEIIVGENDQYIQDPYARIESSEYVEDALANVVLTNDWARDVLAIAKSQLGYQESTTDYVINEEGHRKGYTYYGDLYGIPYGDWCAMFVSFCLETANVEGYPISAGCQPWIEKLQDENINLWRPATGVESNEQYRPKPGDLIFYDYDLDGVSDHVGIVSELIDATNNEPALIKTIEGNFGDQVCVVIHAQSYEGIMGYGDLPENPDYFEQVESSPLVLRRALTRSESELLYVMISVRELGDATINIEGATFRLYYEDEAPYFVNLISDVDGVLHVLNGDGTIEEDVTMLPMGNYRLVQLTSDATHRPITTPIRFNIRRIEDIAVENELIDPSLPKVSVQVKKTWVDQPDTTMNATIRLYANGEDTGETYIVSSANSVTTFSFNDLPKYDVDHGRISYSVAEDELIGYYGVVKNPSQGYFEIDNYEGFQVGTAQSGSLWVATSSYAYLVQVDENGSVSCGNQLTLMSDAYAPSGFANNYYGHGIAYWTDGADEYLFAINNYKQMVVVTDPSTTTTIAGRNNPNRSFLSINGVDGDLTHTLECSSDGQYLMLRAGSGSTIYMLPISKVLSVSNGGSLNVNDSDVIKINATYTEGNRRVFCDGDIVQLPSGDLLFTGYMSNSLYTGSRSQLFLIPKTGNGWGACQCVGEIANIATLNAGSMLYRGETDGLAMYGGKLYFTSSYTTANGPFYVYPLSQLPQAGNPSSTVYTVDTASGISLPSTLFNRINSLTDASASPPSISSAYVSSVVSKIWLNDSAETRPASITVQIYVRNSSGDTPYLDGNGDPITRQLSPQNGWSASISASDALLPKYDSGGNTVQYVWKEVSVPTGYISSIDSTGHTITNQLLIGSLKIRKVDADDHSIILPDASFTLYADDQLTVVGRATTDANGEIIFNNLQVGTWYLRETTAPEGYNQITDEMKIVVSEAESGQASITFYCNNVPIEIEPGDDAYIIENEKTPLISLTIQKMVVGGNQSESFPFEIIFYDSGGDIITNISEGEGYSVDETTGLVEFSLSNDQSVTILNIPLDATATIRETNHNGYTVLIKDGSQTLFSGDSGSITVNEHQSITVINNAGVILPETGGSGTLPYTLSGIALMLAALMYGCRWRKRERRSVM